MDTLELTVEVAKLQSKIIDAYNALIQKQLALIKRVDSLDESFKEIAISYLEKEREKGSLGTEQHEVHRQIENAAGDIRVHLVTYDLEKHLYQVIECTSRKIQLVSGLGKK